MILCLTTLIAISIVFVAIHIISLSYWLYVIYSQAIMMVLIFLGYYPICLSITLWILENTYENAIPNVLLELYWIVIVILSIPSAIYFLISAVFLIFALFGLFRYPPPNAIKNEKKRRDQLRKAITNCVTDPVRAPKPHIFFKKMDQLTLRLPKYFGFSDKSTENILLSLYFSRIFRNVKIDFETTNEEKNQSAEALEHSSSDISSQAIDNDYPRNRIHHSDSQTCPHCLLSFCSTAAVIQSPCCRQCYHQSCYFARLSVAHACLSCDGDVYDAMYYTLAKAANDDSIDRHLTGRLTC